MVSSKQEMYKKLELVPSPFVSYYPYFNILLDDR